MNALVGLFNGRKAWVGASLVAGGQALVQAGQLPATWWWAGACALGAAFMFAQAHEDRPPPEGESNHEPSNKPRAVTLEGP